MAAAAQLALDDDGRCIDIALGLGGVGDRAIRVDVSGLIGAAPSPTAIADAVRAALADIDIGSDLHVSASYRRRVAVTLAIRALGDAMAEARAQSGFAGETLQ